MPSRQTISVIIPTWNRAATIEKAVRSALHQTYPPMEVLVCDDGSTDNTREIVLAINDPRVKWVEGLHSGLPAVPRNRGIALARGEWLAFLDSDDEWLPEKLEAQFALADRLGCSVVCSNAYRSLSDGEVKGVLLEHGNEILSFVDIMRVNLVICSSVIVKKGVVTEVGCFPERGELKALEDYALWLRIASKTSFAYAAEPLLYYRDDALNSVRAAGGNYWTQRKIVLRDFLEWVTTDKKWYFAFRKILQLFPWYLYAFGAYLIENYILRGKCREQIAQDYLNIPWRHQTLISDEADPRPLDTPPVIDIVAVAFNNEMVIEEQIRLLRKNLLDSFHYTVADNSPDPELRHKIRNLCRKLGASYVSLPPNPFTGIDPSLSHGLALNWMYRNYFELRKASIIGFLDHDIFPTKPTRIAAFLKDSPVFGLIQTKGKIWYLWPGFCFFRQDFLEGRNIDFRPGKDCDTGGKNWKTLYSQLDNRLIYKLNHEYGYLREGSDPQSDLYEIIGDWVHTFNASNWKKVLPKQSLVKEFLAGY